MGVFIWGNDFTTAIVHTHWNPTGSLSFSNPGNGLGDIPTYTNYVLNGSTLNYYLVNRNAEIIFTAPNAEMNGLTPEKTLFGIPILFGN